MKTNSIGLRLNKTRLLSRWNEYFILMVLITFKLSCGLTAKKDSSAPNSVQLPSPYVGALGAEQSFSFSEAGVIASSTVRAADSKTAKDPKVTLFANGGLYKTLTLRCTPCHAGRNDFPFASPGIDLAWISAKKYIADPPENSKFIQQIRAGHNGAQAAWEADFAPLIRALAKP